MVGQTRALGSRRESAGVMEAVTFTCSEGGVGESRRRAHAGVLLTLSVWKITPAGTGPRLLTKTPTSASYCLLTHHTLPTCANR